MFAPWRRFSDRIRDGRYRIVGRDDVAERAGPMIRAGPRPQRIVVTGAAGLMGGILREALNDYEIIGLDVRPSSGVEIVADMRDLAAVESAFEGADAVIDLAADSAPDAPWANVLANNLPAAANALEAARSAGVRRLIQASSNHVVGGYEREAPYAAIVSGDYRLFNQKGFPRLDRDVAFRPDGPYAAGKAFGEALGRYYSDRFGSSIICLRIGTLNAENRPLNARHRATLLTHNDFVQLIRCSLAAPTTLRFGVYYGISANRWRIWDIEAARREIGYEPSDDAAMLT